MMGEVQVFGCTPTSNLIVPDLLNFIVEKNVLQTEIEWMMMEDMEVDYYEIETSTDGIGFEILDTKVAEQMNSPRHYQLTDIDPEFGENYYRLKVVYLDGSYFYSTTRMVNYEIDFGAVIIYPNPTNQRINVTLKDFAGKEGVVEIFNALGQRQFVKVDNHRRIVKQFVVVDE